MCFFLAANAFSLEFVGVNLAGAEFGDHNLPGQYGVEYTYSEVNSLDYYINKGVNTIRFPFRWERLQHKLFSDFNAKELTRLKSFVNTATQKKLYVILDPHNYARYQNEIIGEAGGSVSTAAFADFWKRLATEFSGNPRVFFGLMNEPYDISAEQWVAAANEAIAAIRATSAANRILVPGTAFTGAHSWTAQDYYGTLNSVALR